MKKAFKSFIDLIYPPVCEGCGEPIYSHNNLLCSLCESDLPYAFYSDLHSNPLEEKFWGRTKIEEATSLFMFEKSSAVQKLVHKLKYNGTTNIGVELGKKLGSEIKNSSRFNDIDVIIPVPIHWRRKLKRGYNQSEFIAKGISETFGKQVDCKSFIRKHRTKTQTKKNRIQRWQNVEDVFCVVDPESLKNKHILLVDDVITTGSTLEACANTLLQIENVKVSIASIASV